MKSKATNCNQGIRNSKIVKTEDNSRTYNLARGKIINPCCGLHGLCNGNRRTNKYNRKSWKYYRESQWK